MCRQPERRGFAPCRDDKPIFKMVQTGPHDLTEEASTHMANRPSAWMTEWVEAVAGCMEVHSAAGPVGWRYHEEDDLVELVIYATPVELLGGAHDGTIVLPGFSLDVQALESLFERVTALHWRAQGLGPNDVAGPCLSVEGVYRGRPVWLRVRAEAPDDEEPGLELDAAASE